MSILTCLDGIVCLSGFSTVCSACNVVRGCFQCTSCGFDSTHRICHKENTPKELKQEYIDGNNYVDLEPGKSIVVHIYAKPPIEQLPF